MLLAAIHNGADAVYLGTPGFNARAKTIDYSWEELARLISEAHLYGLQVYLALNILIFEEEWPEVIQAVRAGIESGADALIVQDIGLVWLIRSLTPDFPVHASTQMTITHHAAIKLTSDLNISLYVLARELSLPEIQLIRKNTDRQLESFVHGALCISYSGQCLTSESLGGRSANRGICAQACRLEYDLLVDGRKEKTTGPYLVSPRDLDALEKIDELISAGIDVFKIEGRYKSSEYVGANVQAFHSVMQGKKEKVMTRAQLLTFARNPRPGWFEGDNHQELIDPDMNSHTGIFLGEVTAVKKSAVVIERKIPEELVPGAGIAWKSINTVYGSPVFSVNEENQKVTLGIKHNLAHMPQTGDRIYLTSSPLVDQSVQQTYRNRENQKLIPLEVIVQGKDGHPLLIGVRDRDGNEIQEKSELLLERAEKRSLSCEIISEELKKTGNLFQITSLNCSLEQNLFLPLGELKKLRQSLYEKLKDKRTQKKVWEINNLKEDLFIAQRNKAKDLPIKLNLLLREPEQIYFLEERAEFDRYIGCVTLDFEYGRDLQASLNWLRERGYCVAIATSRIIKPGEEREIEQILKLNPDSILVRNLPALQLLSDTQILLHGDFSLNIANSLTANYFHNKGLKQLTPSYDLNIEQLLRLVENSSSEVDYEVVLHQYMPSFHMEYCLFAAHLSEGKDFRSCGEPCREHHLTLKDRKGVEHPIKSDRHCRNTMFMGVPQSALFLVDRLRQAGIHQFRYEALFETSEELAEKVRTYIDYFRGNLSEESAAKNLRASEVYGLSAGTFAHS